MCMHSIFPGPSSLGQWISIAKSALVGVGLYPPPTQKLRRKSEFQGDHGVCDDFHSYQSLTAVGLASDCHTRTARN